MATGRVAAGRFPSHRRERQLPICRRGISQTQILGRAVSSEVAPPRAQRDPGQFLFRVCRCEPSWTMAISSRSHPEGQASGRPGRVICGSRVRGFVGGGFVVHRAVGDRLTAFSWTTVFCARVSRSRLKVCFAVLQDESGVVDAAERFLAKLAGVEDPSRNARSSPRVHRVFEEEARKRQG